MPLISTTCLKYGVWVKDVTPWLDFFFSMFLKQSREAVDLLSRENIEKLLSPKQLLVWQHIEKMGIVGPGDISKATGVARPTINQAVDKLLRLKRVERIGLGRTTKYKKLI